MWFFASERAFIGNCYENNFRLNRGQIIENVLFVLFRINVKHPLLNDCSLFWGDVRRMEVWRKIINDFISSFVQVYPVRINGFISQ